MNYHLWIQANKYSFKYLKEVATNTGLVWIRVCYSTLSLGYGLHFWIVLYVNTVLNEIQYCIILYTVQCIQYRVQHVFARAGTCFVPILSSLQIHWSEHFHIQIQQTYASTSTNLTNGKLHFIIISIAFSTQCNVHAHVFY